MMKLEQITRKMPMPLDPATYGTKSKQLVDSLSRKQDLVWRLERETDNFKAAKKTLGEQIAAEDGFIANTTLELHRNMVVTEAPAVGCYDYHSGLQCERRADNGEILAGSVQRIDSGQTGLFDEEKSSEFVKTLPAAVLSLCLLPVTAPEEKPVELKDSSFPPAGQEEPASPDLAAPPEDQE